MLDEPAEKSERAECRWRNWTEEDHQESRAICDALPAEEWCAVYDDRGMVTPICVEVKVKVKGEKRSTVASYYACELGQPAEEAQNLNIRRALFTAHARKTLPYLLDEIERLNGVCVSHEHIMRGQVEPIGELERRLLAADAANAASREASRSNYDLCQRARAQTTEAREKLNAANEAIERLSEAVDRLKAENAVLKAEARSHLHRQFIQRLESAELLTTYAWHRSECACKALGGEHEEGMCSCGYRQVRDAWRITTLLKVDPGVVTGSQPTYPRPPRHAARG